MVGDLARNQQSLKQCASSGCRPGSPEERSSRIPELGKGMVVPCVDAPTNARKILFSHEHVVERCRVSGLKMRLSHAAGPYGSAQIGSITLTRAQRRFGTDWFSRPRPFDRLPITSLRLTTSADGPGCRLGGSRNLVNSTVREQSPSDPRHLVRQSCSDEQSRLLR